MNINSSDFKVEFQEGVIGQADDDALIYGYIASVDYYGIKCVVSEKTKEKAFDEIIISIKVLLAYNSGVNLI